MMSSQQNNGMGDNFSSNAFGNPNNQDFFQPQMNTQIQMQSVRPQMDPAGVPPPPQQQQQQQPQQSQHTTWWGTCMSCCDIQTYKRYFDVDTSDISSRIAGALMYFYVPDKFRNDILGMAPKEGVMGKGPDLYGPFWITMTLIFSVAVSSNAELYFHSKVGNGFHYDISHLLNAFTLVTVFGWGLPSLLWLLMKCLGLEGVGMVELICLYGYSLTPFLIATLLCMLPWEFLIWVGLLLATVMSGMLILRNLAGLLLQSDSTTQRAGSLLLFIFGCHFLFFLVLKFTFY